MAKRLSSADLANMQSLLDQGRLSDFYDRMGDAGYKYADWANGVVKTDTVAGISAVDYLTGSAMMGLGIQACRNLGDAQLQNIKTDMADAYLKLMQAKAKSNGGFVDQDLDSKEVYDIHADVFNRNGLDIQDWTLDAPFKVIEKLYGKDALEKVWDHLRDTGGGDLTSSAYNTALMALMKYESKYGDPDIKAMAQQWLDSVDLSSSLTKRLNQLLPADLISRFPEFFGGPLVGQLPIVPGTVHDKFQGSQKSSSPLVFDLDGDGIEITQLSDKSTTLFDLNADGRRTQMAWASPDDAFLALDRDGNGLIDTGKELFGDQTVLANGKKAADGYAAQAELDSNHDGQLDAQDARFADLRLWRDLDQNGISDSSELLTLAQLDITQINLNKTAGTQTLADGTRLDGTATFTQGGQMRTYTDAWLAENPFVSAFTSHTDQSDAISALPQMQGSGAVRDLQGAAAQSAPLQGLLAQFQQAGTRQAQMALMDPLLKAWADTSDLTTVTEWEAAGHNVTYAFYGQDAAGTELWKQRLSVLEAFNGENYHPLAKTGTTAISTASARQALLVQSYDALTQGVYGALVVQTRLKPYLDAIAVRSSDMDVSLDASGLNTLLDQRFAADPQAAVTDLVELDRYATPLLTSSEFDGTGKLRTWLDAQPTDSPLLASLADLNVQWGDATVGTKGSDIYIGNSKANRYSGGDGDDLIDGGQGNDKLYGRDGNDTLLGGAGNDTLEGDAGNDRLIDASLTSNDIYVWGRDMGMDTVSDAGGTDRLDIQAGVTADQLWLSRDGDDLTVSLIGTSDSLTVSDWFTGAGHQLESLRLSDGKALAADRVQALIDAMATMSPPVAGQTAIPPGQTALQQLVSSSWV
jgi:Ca2+-binding RTX toxin-like protein